MKANRVTLITLGVADTKRARTYYEALGWEVEEDLGEAVFFAMNGMKFGFFTLEGLANETGKPVEELRTGAMTLAQNFSSPEEVEAMFTRAVASGGTALAQPFKTDWGGYSSYVADPDGHVWEYAHNPFWTLDEEGRIA
ncbi:VOC family protein [Maritimibacter sp. UBA3975]|uniref:VOC family protein n=1 Tax=Maritimibacter sp. UBA3975 TaxID=1946833 RepID=UPI000C0B9F15|nr:VOC family protein [Maritimibacter sp. UBA3975]MAM63560.1 glyoxalase [Maritimibacter sp.]|tara:strand:- start:46838 stop:47254 length:417 start_codon:yes stop_codon:yes gene_type:complete